MGGRLVRFRTPHGGSGQLLAAMRRAALNRNAPLSGLWGVRSTAAEENPNQLLLMRSAD